VQWTNNTCGTECRRMERRGTMGIKEGRKERFRNEEMEEIISC
jgi:hypothetical protein